LLNELLKEIEAEGFSSREVEEGTENLDQESEAEFESSEESSISE